MSSQRGTKPLMLVVLILVTGAACVAIGLVIGEVLSWRNGPPGPGAPPVEAPTAAVAVDRDAIYVAVEGKLTAFDGKTLDKLAETTYRHEPRDTAGQAARTAPRGQS
jgi:hypothetical protein